MNKLTIQIYVTARAVSESKPRDVELVPYSHEFSHPDAAIIIWKQRGVSASGRYDQIRHCVMVALQASGVSVAALRDYSQKPKSKASEKVSKKQMRLI